MNISYTRIGDYLLPDLKLEDKERFNIGKMNNIKNRVEEIILKEYIYV